ncbi:hypothetical protein RN616_19925 (plasmid) [Morganella morganii]|uniref:hypothetical protein n=1 Tax=Morganella morganii TaxID=582 RepID=UPI000D90C613|nr:hypothetical protein [Morganella morganii]WNP32586.1 hypothetical protein RN616_19925 [Morganella morganii]SPX81860.1 Uncharacterised protein [Morganella morganii]
MLDNIGKSVIISVLWFCSFNATALEMKTENINTLYITVALPDDLTIMSDSLIEIKYPSKNRPQVVYSNESGSVSFGVSEKNKPDLIHLDEVKDVMLESMKVLNPKASPLTVDGHNAWLITFKSQAIDSKILNMQLITMTDKKFLIATFNMTEKNIGKYHDIGVLSLSSIKFN